MKSIAHDPVKLTLACAFLVLPAASLVRPPYPEYLWLQHVPTALASVAITLWDRRWPLGRGALACTLGMLALHVVGARYIYSLVPYDEWARTVIGIRPSEVLGLDRNHYDHVVHLAFGLLLVRPIREFLETYRGYGRRGAVVAWGVLAQRISMLCSDRARPNCVFPDRFGSRGDTTRKMLALSP